MLAGYSLHTLEYVHVSVSLSHKRRGDVELVLVCPSGTSSIIGAHRSLDKYFICHVLENISYICIAHIQLVRACVCVLLTFFKLLCVILLF